MSWLIKCFDDKGTSTHSFVFKDHVDWTIQSGSLLSAQDLRARLPLRFLERYKSLVPRFVLVFPLPLFSSPSPRHPITWSFTPNSTLYFTALQFVSAIGYQETMFHTRNLSNTRSTPMAIASKPTRHR